MHYPPAPGGGMPPTGMAPPMSKNSQLRYRRLSDDHKPVDVRAVEALLSERLAHKMNRNFARADQIRDKVSRYRSGRSGPKLCPSHQLLP